MKTCIKCMEPKDESEFYRNRDRLLSTCKPCHNKERLSYYHAHAEEVAKRRKLLRVETREKLFEYLLAHPCIDCGEKDPLVLDFDHLRDKTDGISRMRTRSNTWARILKEIAKCEVRCANCHRRVTHRRANAHLFQMAQRLAPA